MLSRDVSSSRAVRVICTGLPDTLHGRDGSSALARRVLITRVMNDLHGRAERPDLA